jgi:hypothetical protein
MNIKTLFAAAAIAGMSTTAMAQNVTTPTGDIVMIQKNQSGPGSMAGSTPAGSAGSLALMGLSPEQAAIIILFLFGAAAAASSSGSGSGSN